MFVEQLDWRACVERYDRAHTLFFMDPPYWQTEGYGVEFPLTEYEALADALRALKGKAILTLNDHPRMRQVFAEFQAEVVDITYTVGGGDKSAERKELLIYSWDEIAEPSGLF